MVLATAVIAGIFAGLARAWLGKRSYQSVSLRLPGLVLFSFIPQLAAFYLRRVRVFLPDAWAPVLLVSSQSLLMWFAWANRKLPGFRLLGGGLLLNFLVIVLNGGLMPISPETVRKLYPDVPETKWQVGRRLGNGKDIVLPPSATHLEVLADRFMLPKWARMKVAFSLGDVLIALGAFWLLWKLGGSKTQRVDSDSLSIP